MNDFLKNLSVGDDVIIIDSLFNTPSYKLGKVTKIRFNTIFIDGYKKFSKKTGKRNQENYVSLIEATSENLRKIVDEKNKEEITVEIEDFLLFASIEELSLVLNYIKTISKEV